jgi:hypothetical protein
MIQNVQLVAKHYPGWKVYIYVSPDVDQGFIQQISAYPNVVLKPTGKIGDINRLERLFAIDESDVETMFVRDADSRVHWRDRWAINDFLSKPQFIAHSIRDHPEHNAKILAGMWGMHKRAGISITALFDMYLKNPIYMGYGTGIEGTDQNFLCSYVYPVVKPRILVHHSNERIVNGEHTVRIPFPFSKEFHCGRVEDETFVDIQDDAPRRMILVNGRFKI